MTGNSKCFQSVTFRVLNTSQRNSISLRLLWSQIFNNCVWRPLPQSLILLLAAFEDSKTRMKYFSYSVLGFIISTLNYLTEIEIKLCYSISNVTLKPNESGLWCALLMRSTFSLWNGSEPVLLKYWILPIRCHPWEIGRRCIALSDFILLAGVPGNFLVASC